jgi:hypothetical protein
MVQRSEQHSNVAAVYEKLSANESATHATRSAFARKANLHRILARLAAPLSGEETADAAEYAESEPDALLFSPLRLWRTGRTYALRD